MQALAEMYDPKVVPELRVTVQFVFSPPQDKSFNPGPARWYLSIGDNQCHIYKGSTALPTLTINTPNEVWKGIGLGRLDADEAFTNGDFEAEGSMMIMGLFPQIFMYPRP